MVISRACSQDARVPSHLSSYPGLCLQCWHSLMVLTTCMLELLFIALQRQTGNLIYTHEILLTDIALLTAGVPAMQRRPMPDAESAFKALHGHARTSHVSSHVSGSSHQRLQCLHSLMVLNTCMQELERKNGQLLEQRLAQTRAEGEAAQLRLEMDQLRASSGPPAAPPRRKTADVRSNNTGISLQPLWSSLKTP